MMRKNSCLLILFLLLNACTDSNNVPKVDIHGTIVVLKPAGYANGFHYPESRVRMIDVNGKQMPLSEFLRTYCIGEGKEKNEICERGQRIEMIDSSSGPRKDLPAGL